MENSNTEVLQTLAGWLKDAETMPSPEPNAAIFWLATVLDTWGSSPRAPGALWAWNASHGCKGSLSGGCIEEDLIERLHNHQHPSHRPSIIQYGVSAEETQRLKLPCGGLLTVLLEPIPQSTAFLQHITSLLEALTLRKKIARKINVITGEISLIEKALIEKTQIETTNTPTLRYIPITNPQALAPNGSLQFIEHTLSPHHRLLIIGANQTAEYLALFGKSLNYEVWVCDPRENAFDHWPHPWTKNSQAMPDDLIRTSVNDGLSAITTVAHDPRIDDMALMEALRTDAFYIGAMGSKRTSEKRRSRLLQLDLKQSEIDKLHAPIGKAIGSKTPAEIAVAIWADIIEHQHKHYPQQKSTPFEMRAVTPIVENENVSEYKVATMECNL